MWTWSKHLLELGLHLLFWIISKTTPNPFKEKNAPSIWNLLRSKTKRVGWVIGNGLNGRRSQEEASGLSCPLQQGGVSRDLCLTVPGLKYLWDILKAMQANKYEQGLLFPGGALGSSWKGAIIEISGPAKTLLFFQPCIKIPLMVRWALGQRKKRVHEKPFKELKITCLFLS